MRSLLILVLLSGAASATTSGPIKPTFPFMLFGGDQVLEVNLEEPSCLFVDAATVVDLSSIFLRPKDGNGTLGERVLFQEFVKPTASKLDNFGVRCFPDSTKSILFDYGSAFKTAAFSSFEYRSLILFFMSSEKFNGECKGRGPLGGNVHGVGPATASLHADCPAFFLIPSGLEFLFFQSNCPSFALTSASEAAIDIQIEINTVQSGFSPINNRTILSLTSADVPRFYGEQIARNAVELRSNESSWSENVISTDSENAFAHDDWCSLQRDLVSKSISVFEGLVTTDPLNTEQINYLSTFHDHFLPFFSFDVEPYEASCVNLTLTIERSGSSAKVYENPTGSFNYSDPLAFQFLVTIGRQSASECELADVRIRYSAVDIGSPPTTTLSPSTTPRAPISVDQPLPFMLFAGDEVSQIRFREPTCLYVKTAASFNSTTIVFQAHNGDGALGERTPLSVFLNRNSDSDKFGVHCFNDSETAVSVDYGSLFTVSWTASERRMAIFYFTSKEKATGTKAWTVFAASGACKDHGTLGGNVYAATRKQQISLHADCPAVVLSPAGNTVMGLMSDCPVVLLSDFKEDIPKPPKGFAIDITTVQSGVNPIADLSLISSSTDDYLSIYDQEILRSAVMISTNSSLWLQNAIQLQAEDEFEFPDLKKPVCEISWDPYEHRKALYGVITNDPWSPRPMAFDFHVIYDMKEPLVEMQFSDYDPKCLNFTVWYRVTDTALLYKHNPIGALNFTLIAREFNAAIEKTGAAGCDFAYVVARYSVREVEGSTTVPPTSGFSATTSTAATKHSVSTSAAGFTATTAAEATKSTAPALSTTTTRPTISTTTTTIASSSRTTANRTPTPTSSSRTPTSSPAETTLVVSTTAVRIFTLPTSVGATATTSQGPPRTTPTSPGLSTTTTGPTTSASVTSFSSTSSPQSASTSKSGSTTVVSTADHGKNVNRLVISNLLSAACILVYRWI